jgi:K+-sensing histidine kinase KdpD
MRHRLPNLRKLSLKSFEWPIRYGFAGLSLLLAFVLRNELSPLVEDRVPFMFFAPAAIIVAWLAGFMPGFATLLLGVALGQYFFVSPYDALLPQTQVGWLLLAPYFTTTLLAIIFIHEWHKARTRAEEVEKLAEMHVHSLKEQVVERKRVEELLRRATGEAALLGKTSNPI